MVKLEERYVSVRTLFENRLLIVLNNRSFTQQESYTTTKRIVVSESRLVETNEHFRFLQECINWCKDKLVSLSTLGEKTVKSCLSVSHRRLFFFLITYTSKSIEKDLFFSSQKKLNDSEYGNDLAAVEKEYDVHQKEHKIIHQFHTNVDQCAAAEVSQTHTRTDYNTISRSNISIHSTTITHSIIIHSTTNIHHSSFAMLCLSRITSMARSTPCTSTSCHSCVRFMLNSYL